MYDVKYIYMISKCTFYLDMVYIYIYALWYVYIYIHISYIISKCGMIIQAVTHKTAGAHIPTFGRHRTQVKPSLDPKNAMSFWACSQSQWGLNTPYRVQLISHSSDKPLVQILQTSPYKGSSADQGRLRWPTGCPFGSRTLKSGLSWLGMLWIFEVLCFY